MKTIVNQPIASTFEWLKVNGTLAEIPEKEEFQRIHLEEGEEKMLLIKDKEESLHLEIDLSKDSCLHLIQTRPSEPSVTLTKIRALVKEGAQFHWYRINRKGARTYDNCSVLLEGKESLFTADLGYQLGKDQVYDANVEAIHTGKKTESKIFASGVLEKNARKLLRGTIDFRKGCKGALGDEKEEVLLLNEEVVNQSVPVILCEEEDVEGNHGASIGMPEENLMYYLASRGLEEETILKLLSEAKINAVIHRIPEGPIKQALGEEFH